MEPALFTVFIYLSDFFVRLKIYSIFNVIAAINE